MLEQTTLDGPLEVTLGDLGAHATSSRTSILPVTAAEMRAVRSSLSPLFASLTLPMRASSCSVSRMIEEMMRSCSTTSGSGNGRFRSFVLLVEARLVDCLDVAVKYDRPYPLLNTCARKYGLREEGRGRTAKM